MGKLTRRAGMTFRHAAIGLGTISAGRLRRGAQGQGMVEYALMLMLVAMVIVVILGVLGGHVTHLYSNVSTGLSG